ncbi:MAG: DUF4407 domain-containing protein [Nannocystaceae bacterium]
MLGDCSEGEQVRSAILGATLLIPMAIWGFGAGTIAHMMGANAWVSLFAGAGMAVCILVMDRGLMAYLSSKGRTRTGIAARILLATAASAILAHPPTLLFADGVIEDELLQKKQTLSQQTLAPLQRELADARVPVDQEVERLRTSLDAATKTAANAASERAGIEKALRDNHKEADDEALGKTGNGQGEGRRYKRLMREREELSRQDSELKDRVDVAKARVDKLESSLAVGMTATTETITRLTEEIDSVRQEIEDVNHSDPLSRVVALHGAIVRGARNGDYSLAVVYLLICGVLLGLELLPLVIKLGFKKGELAMAFQRENFRAETDIHNFKENYPIHSREMAGVEFEQLTRRKRQQLEHDLDLDLLEGRLQFICHHGERIMDRMEDVWALADKLQARGMRQRPDDTGPVMLGQRLVDRFYNAAREELSVSQSTGGTGGMSTERAQAS